MKKSKEIAFLGLVSALSSVCLLLGTIVSVLDMSSAILASLLLVITFEELQALFDSKEIDVGSLQEENLENASYYGRIFARNCGLSEAVAESLKESGLKNFDLKAVSCDGIEACRIALMKAQKKILDGNFIEGMACVGGCIGGAGCLTHGERNKIEVEKHGKTSKLPDIKSAVTEYEKTHGKK